MNRWNVIALYAAVICLISMGCILFATVTGVEDIFKLTMPWYLEASEVHLYHTPNTDHAAIISAARTGAMKSLVDELTHVVIASVFFFIHWRIMKRALQTK